MNAVKEIKNYSALADIIRQENPPYSGRVLERWFRQKMMESQEYVEIGGFTGDEIKCNCLSLEDM